MLLNHGIRIWSSVEQEMILWSLSEKCHLLYMDMKQITRKQKGVGTQRMTNAHKMLPYSIPNMGSLGGFAQFLTYKTENVGKRVIRIDESHTSQQLIICRKRMKRVFSERVMTCDCENRIGRDLTSLINILECLVH